MINKKVLFAYNTRAAIDIYWVGTCSELKCKNSSCMDIEHGIRLISVYNRKANTMGDWEYST